MFGKTSVARIWKNQSRMIADGVNVRCDQSCTTTYVMRDQIILNLSQIMPQHVILFVK